MHGKLITFEGIDGCGKTTAIRAAIDFLESKEIPIMLTRQPGGTPVGEQIRHLLQFGKTPIGNMTELLLFCASFAQSAETLLRPTLEAGTWILSDRYTDSTRAYQGAGRGIDPQTIDTLLKKTVETHPLTVPYKTFLLDLEPETAWNRINKDSNRNAPDRIEAEGVEFQKKVREQYLQLAHSQKERFIIINSEKLNPQEVTKKIQEELETLLKETN